MGKQVTFTFFTRDYKDGAPPNELWIRKSFSALELWMKVQYVRKESHGQCDDHHPKLLYDDPLPLKPAKVAYLKKKAHSTFVSKFLHESLR